MPLVMGMPMATTMGTKIICHRRAHAISHGHARGLFHGHEEKKHISVIPNGIAYCYCHGHWRIYVGRPQGSFYRHKRNSQICQRIGNICTSDQLWTTENNSCLNYKTIKNSMVTLNHSIQWLWCLRKPLTLCNGSKMWSKINQVLEPDWKLDPLVSGAASKSSSLILFQHLLYLSQFEKIVKSSSEVNNS